MSFKSQIVIMSINIREKVFHIKGCHYVSRIIKNNKLFLTKQNAIERNCRPCKCCCGMEKQFFKFIDVEQIPASANLNSSQKSISQTFGIHN